MKRRNNISINEIDIHVNDAEFDKKIILLKEFYKKDPDYVMELLEDINEEELVAIVEKDKMFNAFSKNNYMLIYAILIIGFVLLGFTASNLFNYYFGLVFFLAGFFVGSFVPFFGIIFLFSHGGTGLGLMISSILENEVYKSLLQDMSNIHYYYFALIVALVVVSIISIILYSVNKKVHQNKKLPAICLGLFLISVILIRIFPLIYTQLASLF